MADLEAEMQNGERDSERMVEAREERMQQEDEDVDDVETLFQSIMETKVI